MGGGWDGKELAPESHVDFLVFLVKALTANNDALFMGPDGEERLWPK